MIANKKEALIIPALSWLIYVSVYLGRINLSITIPYLQNELAYSKASLGLLASGFFCTYAIGQLINGILGDRFQAKYFVSLGLLVAGISNIFFGTVNSFPLMFIAWSINGYFQSMLWGPLLRAVSESTPQDKLQRAMLLMATSPIIGHFLAYILAGQLALIWKWETAFIIPGVLLIAMSGLCYWGMSKITGKKEKGKDNNKKATLFSPRLSAKELLSFSVKSRLLFMVILGISIGIVKEGLTLWGPVIFTEFYSMDMERMLLVMSFMPLVNLIFILLGGLLIKKFFKNEKYTILLFLFITLLPTLLLWQSRNLYFPVIILSFYFLMASIYTVNNQMTTYLPFNFAKNGLVSAVAGSIDSAIYLGAAISGPLIGSAVESFGWDGIFIGILGVCIAALIPGFLLSTTSSSLRQRKYIPRSQKMKRLKEDK